MANTIRLYRGGQPIIQFPNCDSSSVWDVPGAFRIDGVYQRGSFNGTSLFNPRPSKWYENAQYRDAKMVKGAAVGDVIEMFVVPPRHKITDVAVEVDVQMGGSFAPSAGVSFDVVMRHYDATHTDTPASEETLISGVAADSASWKHVDYTHVNNTNERAVVGLKIVSLTSSTDYTLEDMQAYVGLAVACIDFDIQRQM